MHKLILIYNKKIILLFEKGNIDLENKMKILTYGFWSSPSVYIFFLFLIVFFSCDDKLLLLLEVLA